MNPQQDDGADRLNARLSPPVPGRSDSPLSMPARQPSEPLEDIDDSAFNFGAETPKRVPVQMPVVVPDTPEPEAPPVPVLPPPPPVVEPPAPQPTPPVEVPVAAPVPMPTPTVPAAFVPQPSLPPAPVIEPVLPPQAPAPTPPPAPPTPPTVSFSPQPAVAATPTVGAPVLQPATPVTSTLPPTAVAYEPAAPHVASDIVERIDETPQQNSKDIEELIEHNHRIHRLKSVLSFLLFVAGVVVAAFLINQFIFQSYYVDGTSMTPTLQNDDRLIIDKVERTWANIQGKPYIPKRGQIVVLDSSIVGLNGRDEQLIKRVIGLPGDTIDIKDGVVTITNKDNPNGFDVNKQLGLNLQPTYTDQPIELTIPDGQVFVMGDNRVQNGSYDSRAFGPVESSKIVGRLWARILPFDKAQLF